MHLSSLNKEHFVAPGGCNTVVKHFLGESGIKLETGLFLKKLVSNQENNSISAETRCGKIENFDYVLVSIPPPQLLGDIEIEPDIDFQIKEKLAAVKYSSRYALLKYYDDDVDLRRANPEFGDFAVGYTKGRIRYWSIEGEKRGDQHNALMLHTDIQERVQYKLLTLICVFSSWF